MIERHFQQYFEESISDVKPASEIHRDNLTRFKAHWSEIYSSSTCLSCICRRPQHGWHCKHISCEICVQVLGDRCADDPRDFKVYRCFLCDVEMPEEVTIRIHPPTAGAGVLCIDGGGIRGVLPLKLMKRIQDRIGLPIPFQNFFKVAFGVSSGKQSLKHKTDILTTCSFSRRTHRPGNVH
jgi:hypothetical protein